ncbi:MAG TPA: PleD family two-component system response regulator [Acetobacteraceae bacterium]|jgi:two-component system cell cycle response regulator|nr:PleD family two-component system response regulator [Acetobacteraceae bacterium]
MTARVLVVDDVAGNRALLEARLLSEYYEVATAASGPEALEVAGRWMPDVVLLDVVMPGMDGYEVCRRLKAAPATAHVPVVMVTALLDQAERVRGLEAGADDFLSKPLDDAALFARLRPLLRVKQAVDAWRLRAETARDLGLGQPLPPPSLIAGARVLAMAPSDVEALRAMLALDGVHLEPAASPAEAWDRLAGGDFDLLLLDLGPEGGDALRLAARLRTEERLRGLPVLLMADAGQKALVLRGFDLGANDHLFRPVDPNELRARVRNQIRRRRYQERLRSDLDRSLEMAVTDPLTGLRNRRYVRRHLDGVLRGAGAAVLLMDVDRFKAINDTHGHAIGDAVLQEVAARMRGQVRAADVVARYGGEEFLVVMAGTTAADVLAVAERLRAAVAAEPVAVDGLVLPVTISIGVAVATQGMGAEQVLGAADAALYRAKRDGRDRVVLAEPPDPPG